MTETIIAIFVGGVLLAMLIFWLIGERGHLLLPSTWAGMRAGGLRNLLNLKSLHMYAYGRWILQYLNVLLNRIFPILGLRGWKWLRDSYHGKILTPDQAKAIITLNRDIPLRDLEQIIPYPMARDLVLKGPPDVVALECGCRHARANPCQPTQVCMVIGQPFVDFMMEHNPQITRRLTQTEALEFLQAEHERGHLHSAWFKDAMLDRFYAICNCCKCCCGGIEAMVRYGSPMIASSGYVAQVNQPVCGQRGTCVEACPFGALSLDEAVEVNWEKCMGCGVCEGQCPTGAISLVRDERKGIPLDVRLLAQE
jgi:NAD-dependent dihydropyrimidine dehydrogenase PreA subunit